MTNVPGYSIFYKIACAPSEYSDQLAHPRSLIRFFVVHLKTFWILGYPQSAHVKAQSGLSLCWAHIEG